MSDKIRCHVCSKSTAPTKEGRYRVHKDDATGEECDASRVFIPAQSSEALCRNLSTLGAASTTAPSAGSSPAAAPALAPLATPLTGFSRPSPVPAAGVLPASAPAALSGVDDYARQLSDVVAAKPTVFSQPAGRPEREPPAPMTELGKEITARFKETFYSFQNRKTDDNRGAQTTLGPSEIGSPCDRRIAMSLMKIPAVNPGGDGWAAFVGTCGHVGLSGAFKWADAGTGRFASEVPLTFQSALVPRGTSDLLDRALNVVGDFKFMGSYSLNKLRTKGPSGTYRVQVHTYGLGAKQRGETVDHVAIIGLPRDGSSLDDMYVWSEPFDPKIALDALARVERIAARVKELETERAQWAGLDIAEHNLSIAADFPIDTSDGCSYCPFSLPNGKGLTVSGGCNGRA